MASHSVPATPADQIFDGEWEDQDISDNVSESSNLVPSAADGQIRGLGNGLPDVVESEILPSRAALLK